MAPLVNPTRPPSPSAEISARPALAAMRRVPAAAVLYTTVQAWGLTASEPAFAQSPDQTGWYWHMRDGWGQMIGWGGMMSGGIGMFLFWGAIVLLLVLVARRFIGRSRTQSNPPSPQSSSTALDILQERYAKGEINKDEYEQYKKTLAG